MIVHYDDFANIRQTHPDKRIVLLKGSFDLFHTGHLEMIRCAEGLGDVLVVFVKCDAAVRLKGPGRPVIGERDRAQIVDAIRGVDYVIVPNRLVDLGHDLARPQDMNEYLLYYHLVSQLRPDVLIKPPKQLPEVMLDLYRQIGTRIVDVGRGEGVSTTQIIERIRTLPQAGGA